MDRRQLPSPGQTGAEKVTNLGKDSSGSSGKDVEPEQKGPFWKKMLTSCVVVFIILVVIMVLGATYVGAATGLVDIPIISGLIYKIPEPTREVSSEELDSDKIKTRVEKEVSSGRDSVEVYVTEGNLTSILNTSKREEVKIEDAQVAIIDDGQRIELFGKLTNSNIYLTAVYNVGKDFDGNFNIESISSFRIGSVKVPNLLIYINVLSEDTVKNLSGVYIIEDALSDEGSGLEISDVQFTEGKVIEYVTISDYNDVDNTSDLDKDDVNTQVN